MSYQSTYPYDLICLDLDGTLLNDQHQISENSLEYLRWCQVQGIKVAVTTGRTGNDAKSHAEQIGPETYYIGSNGAVVGQAFKDEIIHEHGFAEENLHILRKIANVIDAKPLAFAKQHIYINGQTEYETYKKMKEADPIRGLEEITFLGIDDDFYDRLLDKTSIVHKVVFFLADEKRQKTLEEMLTDDESTLELAIASATGYEVTERGINKSYGIRYLMEYLDISQERIIAFGDSENDRAMLEFVGHGVAMEKASESLKTIADGLAGSNDKEGVVNYLKHIFTQCTK